jgi:hypothetical protein
MPIVRSTEAEFQAIRELVARVEREIAELVAAGKKVHVIWDVDHVLVSGRSDDAYVILGGDVRKYFTHEERLVAETLDAGPWLGLARKCGELHQSQDVVTARSSFLALRVTFFLLEKDIPVRWQLFVGHQPKGESYRIILKSFANDPGVHVYNVDDTAKHDEAFRAVAAELGMSDRCHGVLAPQVRGYDEDELRHEVEGVMQASGEHPSWVRTYDPDTGRLRRMIRVLPDPRKDLRNLFWLGAFGTHKKAVVEELRPDLEKFAAEVMPGKVPTDDDLFMLFEMVRAPH